MILGQKSLIQVALGRRIGGTNKQVRRLHLGKLIPQRLRLPQRLLLASWVGWPALSAWPASLAWGQQLRLRRQEALRLLRGSPQQHLGMYFLG